MSDTLRITEIFCSLQGEASTVGCPTVFVRLTGCPLRCHYCDSEYAFYGGQKETLDSLLERVISFKVSRVCVTGGEPLAQPTVLRFLAMLCDAGLQVSLETSGAMPIAKVDPRVSIVMDLKTPDSGELEKNLYENIPLLQRKDQVKFVICSRKDFDWACFKLSEYELEQRVGEVLFSPSFEQMSYRSLADWIIENRLPVRFQIQLHKIIWGDIPGV